jgi:endoribonuclease Dicer
LAEREKETANSKDDTIEDMQHLLNDARINDDPREYQRTLFEIAKSRNTIVILGTGFGKTLVALLLIRHHGAAFREGKQTLFLVPSVALAIQQSVTLRANLPNYSIQTACYETASTSIAREELAKANVVVATHGAVSKCVGSRLSLLQYP